MTFLGKREEEKEGKLAGFIVQVIQTSELPNLIPEFDVMILRRN